MVFSVGPAEITTSFSGFLSSFSSCRREEIVGQGGKYGQGRDQKTISMVIATLNERLLTCCLCRSNGVKMCLFNGALLEGDPEPSSREGEVDMDDAEERM